MKTYYMKCAMVLSLTAFSSVSTGSFAAEDDYPSRPIRIVVPFAPGGGGDTVTRIMAESMSKTLNQTILVENRPGAFTTIAPTVVANAKPDGYTLLFAVTSAFGADKALFPNTVNYDEKSFTPISNWANTFFVLGAHKDYEANNFSGMLEKARKDAPNPTFIASTQGLYPQLIVEKIERMTGVKLTLVPYKGGAPAVMAAASGEPPLTMAVPSSVIPLAKEGRLKALAITNGQGSELAEGVPTIAEFGLEGYHVGYWSALAGPAGLPDHVVQKLFEASKIALSDPEVRAKLIQIGYEPAPSSSVEEFQAQAIREGLALRDDVLAMGLKVE